jgi:hypothetical protein
MSPRYLAMLELLIEQRHICLQYADDYARLARTQYDLRQRRDFLDLGRHWEFLADTWADRYSERIRTEFEIRWDMAQSA